jgi:hypothetical protein
VRKFPKDGKLTAPFSCDIIYPSTETKEEMIMDISNSLNRIEEILDLLDWDFFENSQMDDGEREKLGVEADAIAKKIGIVIDYGSYDWKFVG